MNKIVLLAALGFLYLPAGVCAQEETPANALLLLPSDKTAFDTKFQSFLASKDAKLLQSFPPVAFIGYIPQTLDADLERKYGAQVYRDKVEDMSEFFKRGENAVFAVNAWNKRFLEDPSAAPVVVTSRVNQAQNGAKMILRWNYVMKADRYRLQISSDSDFSANLVETTVDDNFYNIYPAFFHEGVYYWRVEGLLTLNNGEKKEGSWSETYSFAVPGQPGAPKSSAPQKAKLPAYLTVKGGKVFTWEKTAKYYRLQIAETADFEGVIVDEMTDKNTRKPLWPVLESGRTYYLRLTASDGAGPYQWSIPVELNLDRANPASRSVMKIKPAK
ncbi:MAG: hypothetical protein NTX59_11195 [Elusimicrobia bacterium]|nr:hypothetical protein [Elusimicrobiota bacterium]